MNSHEKAGFVFCTLIIVVGLIWLFVSPGDTEKDAHAPQTGSLPRVVPSPEPENSFTDSGVPIDSQPVEEIQAVMSAQKDQLALKIGAPPLRIPPQFLAQQRTAMGGTESGSNRSPRVSLSRGTESAEDAQLINYDGLLETLSEALQIKNPEERRIRLDELGAQLAQDDPNIAFDVLDHMENFEDRKTFISGFLGTLYQGVPGDALYWVGQLSDAKLSLFAHNFIATQGVQQDIQATYEWALQLEDSNNRLEVLKVIGKTLAKEDPQSTVEWAMQFDDEFTRDQLVANTIGVWAVKDMIGLANWAISLPETEENNVIISRQFSLWTQFSPQNASEWAVKVDDHDLMTKAVTTVATSWSRSNHQEAAQWLLENDQIDRRFYVPTLHSIIKDWSEKDPDSVNSWLENVSDPEVKKSLSGVIGGE